MLKRFLLSVLLFVTLMCICALTCAANSADNSGNEIQTMLHSGHPVKQYVTSYDERYIFTRGDAEICIWDMRNRMLVKTLPVKTSRIAAHPVDSRLIYVCVDDRHADLTNSTAEYGIMDWTDGEFVGYVSRSQLPETRATSDMEICISDDILIMVPRVPNVVIDSYIGGTNINIGSAHTGLNDSLLVTSGMIPQVWDLKHAALIDNIPYYKRLGHTNATKLKKTPWRQGYRPNINTYAEAYFVPGSDDIILGGVRDTVYIYHRPGGEVTAIPVNADPSPVLTFHGDTIIAATAKGIYRSVGRKPFEELTGFRGASATDEFNTVSRSYGGGRFLAGSSDGRRGKASLMEGRFGSDTPTRVADKTYGWVQDIKISPSEDYAVVTYGMRGISRVDLTGDTLRYGPALKAPWLDDEKITRCEILPDGTIAGGTTLGGIFFWPPGNEDNPTVTRRHHANINSMTLSADGQRMFTTDRAGQITIWDTKTRAPELYLYQVLGLQEPAYVILTDDHYYKATPNAREFINFVRDGVPYAFEQFDLRNNRPDIVLSRLGGDPAEVEMLHKAWQKRLRRAGISPESLSADYHVPVSEIKNRDRLPSVTAEKSITLDIDCHDTEYDLNEISVMLNGVPVLPSDMRTAAGRHTSFTLPLDLAAGNNQIVVTCLNQKGARSMRDMVNIAYTPPETILPDLYVVAVGVSEYNGGDYNLGFAAKDAGDFVELLRETARGNFGDIKPLLITDEAFTPASMDRIKDFIGDARRDDVVMLFYAGHGVLDRELDYFLATSNMDFSSPRHGGIPYDEFISVLDGNGSVNRYVFIDACHSGELDKEDYMAVTTVSMPAGEELVFRSSGASVEARADVERVNALLSDMFTDIRWGSGATVLSSAGGDELAVESDRWRNGLFTYCLKQGLRDNRADADGNGTITLREWMDYTSRQVSELSDGRQSPTLRSQNHYNDLKIK